MPRRAPTIATYSLFGELAHLPDVMHCETIAARSVLHDWEFAPHRHGRLHQVLVVESGGGSVHLDGAAFPLCPPALLNVPRGCVHGFSFARGTQGFVATLPDELVDDLLANAGDARHSLRQVGLVGADAAARATIRQIWREFSAQSPARALVLRGLCTTLLGLVARAVERAAGAAGQRESPLLRRFDALLEAHYLEHWKVADYARALAVSATHLTRVVRAATGETVSALIDARVMREARRNLAYTSMRVATVAYALGFADPAYFTRAFTRTVGVSPRLFRDRLAARPGRSPARRRTPAPAPPAAPGSNAAEPPESG
ncbi:MAG TPA: helix-turn-helix domain-containing protein [Burkholderiaceae bacterium]|nr:helix-turn-helix domain-containing protein [Burkholderiaceae bacterium]